MKAQLGEETKYNPQSTRGSALNKTSNHSWRLLRKRLLPIDRHNRGAVGDIGWSRKISVTKKNPRILRSYHITRSVQILQIQVRCTRKLHTDENRRRQAKNENSNAHKKPYPTPHKQNKKTPHINSINFCFNCKKKGGGEKKTRKKEKERVKKDRPRFFVHVKWKGYPPCYDNKQAPKPPPPIP